MVLGVCGNAVNKIAFKSAALHTSKQHLADRTAQRVMLPV
jgi:hypothetical protein